VLSELNAETVLHYVIALEGLLTGDESPTELTRKVSQRAAILAGRSDAQRLEIERLVSGAYGARSKYAHGDTPKGEVDLPKLCRVVRRCLLARLVIGTRRRLARSAKLQTKPCCPARSWSAAYTIHLTSSRGAYGRNSIQPWQGYPRTRTATCRERHLVPVLIFGNR
jgi:hypothetical protein